MTSPTPYQLLPRLSDDEFAALREDIRENGIRVPIDVDEDNNILDGHHRSWIAAELDIDAPRRVVSGLDDQGKRNHARAVNALRRHLSIDQRRDQVAQMRAEGQTIQAISTTLGVPKSTVGDDIQAISETGITSPATITASDGRERPATYTRKETTKVEESTTVDLDTGEVVDDAPIGGQTYSRPEPSAPRRSSLIDDARNAGWQLRKAIERLERIHTDDRFSKNKVEVMAALQPHLDLANEVLSNL